MNREKAQGHCRPLSVFLTSIALALACSSAAIATDERAEGATLEGSEASLGTLENASVSNESGASLAALPPDVVGANVILILLDDLGAYDFSSYGNTFNETPNIDRVAAEGMKFTRAHAAAPICSPTRAAILTGKSPARLHLTDWIPGYPPPFDASLIPPNFVKQLPLRELTLAEALKPAGYISASIGKWHLGGPSYYPDKQGFDVNLAGTNKYQPPSFFSPYGIPTLPDGPPGEYLTDRLTDEALRFIDAHHTRPFFLYLPHFAVHVPIQAKASIVSKYSAKADSTPEKARYAAMLESVDQGVGRIMERLAELGIDRHTVVIITSDNGGLLRNTSNAPLRSGKGGVYNGAVRVPLTVRWPDVVPPRSVDRTLVISMDLYSTILEIAGVATGRSDLDGVSLVPTLTRTGKITRDALYWHYPHYNIPSGGSLSRGYGAIRMGSWRLVEFYEDGRVELYRLADDIGETNDLAAEMPYKANQLKTILQNWRRAVGAQMPTPR